MLDITLFSKLWSGVTPADVEQVVSLLDELAARPVSRRRAWFAALGATLEHRDLRLRRAAMRALVGADGRMALAAFLTALDDEDADVRRVAVEGLRAVAARDAARWAFVVFHHRDDVRMAATEPDTDGAVSPLCFYLLADPVCRGRLLSRLGGPEEDATLPLPPHAYPTLVAFTDTAQIDADQALRLLVKLPIGAVLAQASRGGARSEQQCDALFDDAGAVDAVSDACRSRDGYDGLFTILARAGDPRVATWRQRLGAACVPMNWSDRRRITASARSAMLHLGDHPELALFIAALEPGFLLKEAVPIAVRERAAADLAGITHPLPIVEETLLDGLFGALAVDRSGKPNLASAAGLVRLARGYKLLLRWVPQGDLVAAMVADPEQAAKLLLIPDDAKRGRRWILSEIAAADRGVHARVLASLAQHAPADKLGFVEELSAHDAMALAMCLTSQEPRVVLKHNKRRSLVPLLVEILHEHLDGFARAYLSHADPEERRFGRELFEALANRAGGETFAMKMAGLPQELLHRLVVLMPHCTLLTYGCEFALASVLVDHQIEDVQSWARARVPVVNASPPPVVEGVVHLSETQCDEIATCDETALASLVEPYRLSPTVALALALARRPSPRPDAVVCAALLGCHDDLEVVAEQFARFASTDPSFVTSVDRLAVRWERCRNLPVFGSAWLWRWERHAFAVARHMAVAPARPLKFLRRTLALPCQLLRARVWRALGEAVSVWAVREVSRVHMMVAGEAAAEAVELIVAQLDTDVDVGAAKLFSGLCTAGVAAAIDGVPRVKAMLPDVSREARAHLERVVSARGLFSHERRARKRSAPAPDADLDRIRNSHDPAELEGWCRAASERLVQEAALRAVELGGDMFDRLAKLIVLVPRVPCRRTLIESVALWSEHPSLGTLRSAVDGEGDDELRFRLCLAFDDRREAGFLVRATDIVARAGRDAWFRPEDYARLSASRGALETAVALAASEQPHAYMRAIPTLITLGSDDASVLDALRAFLRAGSTRLAELRRDAALYLHQRGDALGFPLVLEAALDAEQSYGTLFKGLSSDYVDAVVDAALLAGPSTLSEGRVMQLLEPVHVASDARDRAHERLLVEATLERTAERIANIFASRGDQREERDTGLSRVARVFAWGTREGLALTRRRHSVHMSERHQLGYTRFDQDKIWVSALPILRGDRHGEAIVEALILHEIGHHRHHRGKVEQEIWDQASKDGLFGLLNLVADEHLERNLRALDATYGDRLKRLAAHAFRHASRDIPVDDLVALLGPASFHVLSTCSLGLAQQAGKVRVDSGKLLATMERTGMSFTRFMRALRMGLGDRYGDENVTAALKLFPKSFRHYGMPELLRVAEQLRDIFGWETVLCKSYGGHETSTEEAREEARWGRGIKDDDVQREVRRILNPKKLRGGSGAGDPNQVWINVSEDEEFELIHNVQRIEPDRAAHRAVARDVARHARRLRGFLDRLGLSHQAVRRRLKGTRLDRGRLTAMVTRRDPRVLVSREVVKATDLFVAVVVDCSGSMAGGGHINKARRFAVLVAEAVRDLDGVDARFFGFTDSVIYDAGDARRCGAARLEPSGGNNDAAAIHHAALVARRSSRKAKLLVMISDGLPTECSAGALKSLVARVTRSGVCVAQVAVCPLEEVCFPHYVVLEGELDASVRRFGQVVSKLVMRVMA